MITALLTFYNITEFPAVVIEEKPIWYQDTDRLLGYVCDEFIEMKKKYPKNALIFIRLPFYQAPLQKIS